MHTLILRIHGIGIKRRNYKLGKEAVRPKVRELIQLDTRAEQEEGRR